MQQSFYQPPLILVCLPFPICTHNRTLLVVATTTLSLSRVDCRWLCTQSLRDGMRLVLHEPYSKFVLHIKFMLTLHGMVDMSLSLTRIQSCE